MSAPAMPRLMTDLWVDAEVRRAASQNWMAYRLYKGDKERGSVMIKVADMKGQAYILTQTMDFDGNRVWARRPASGQEAETLSDERVKKARTIDPDLWVIEIEDPSDCYSLLEPISKDL